MADKLKFSAQNKTLAEWRRRPLDFSHAGLPYSPFESDGRYDLHPYGSLFWSRLSENALRPYIQYFNSI